MNQDFAAFLRAQRRQRNLSQAGLAQRAQISERTLRYWEKGTSSPGRWELESILTALGLTPQERIQALNLLPTLRGMNLSRQEAQISSASVERGPIPTLGDLLKAMRQRNRLSQEQMAAALQIARSTILRWEATETLPSEENLERVCVLLGAYPEERKALLDRRLSLGVRGPSLSVEECAEQVVALDSHGVGQVSPLLDLRALALKRQLWMLADQSQEALRLLAHVQVVHASWLDRQERKKEAQASLQQSLIILKANFRSDSFLQAAVNLAAHFAGEKQGDSAASVKLLKHWLPVFPRQMQTTLWCDIALYAGQAQQHEAATRYLANALAVLPHSSDPAGMSRHYYPLTRARTLVSAGLPVEALEWLPSIPTTEPITLRTLYQVLWAETLLEAGEKGAARDYIDQLNTSLIEYPQPSLQRRLHVLSERL